MPEYGLKKDNIMGLQDHIEKFIVVGDKVLIKPKKHERTTKSGLYLPPGVKEKEIIQSGYIVKVGPGPVFSVATP